MALTPVLNISRNKMKNLFTTGYRKKFHLRKVENDKNQRRKFQNKTKNDNLNKYSLNHKDLYESRAKKK